MEISRRGLFVGFASLLAAPAIVRASSLMPVKALDPGYLPLHQVGPAHAEAWLTQYRQEMIRAFEANYSKLLATTQEEFVAFGSVKFEVVA